eukprot:3639672-Rhodomonas_salina.1
MSSLKQFDFPELPEALRSAGADVVVRPLEFDDNKKGFFTILSQLTSAPELSQDHYMERFMAMRARRDEVLETCSDDCTTRSFAVFLIPRAAVQQALLHGRGRASSDEKNCCYRDNDDRNQVHPRRPHHGAHRGRLCRLFHARVRLPHGQRISCNASYTDAASGTTRRHLGVKLMHALQAIGKELGCYKVILDCSNVSLSSLSMIVMFPSVSTAEPLADVVQIAGQREVL